ncbi:hypothetical protein, partial [Tabrizicola thermarum]|uniref:hypothetical protein n=1 Tax=Tabrizicola thermarum TaxID=2670345 RepID=UPI00192E6025
GILIKQARAEHHGDDQRQLHHSTGQHPKKSADGFITRQVKTLQSAPKAVKTPKYKPPKFPKLKQTNPSPAKPKRPPKPKAIRDVTMRRRKSTGHEYGLWPVIILSLTFLLLGWIEKN